MAEIVLAASTGSAQMDTAVKDMLACLAASLPGRLSAVYVLGSYADASAVPTSDLDLVLIIADRFREGEHARIQTTLTEYTAQRREEIDLEVTEEASLRAGVSPTLKLSGRLLWGIDLCQHLALMPLNAWTRDRMYTSYWRLGGLFSRSIPLTMPLDYPDATDEFYGYARRLTRLPDGRLAPGTRDLMRAVGWMATALIAYQAGRYVGTKRACADMYREHIGGEWVGLLDDLAAWVRGAWQYCIPTAPEERARLSAICGRALGFENHFLALYRRYVMAELRGDDPAGRQLAIEALERTPLADAELMRILASTRR